jgi:uncharacterized protein (TIGR02444 family)
MARPESGLLSTRLLQVEWRVAAMSEASAGSSRTNPFWDFSLAIYASQEVQKACLDLQDGSGVDVNVLLYLLWQARQGRRLDLAGATAVLAAVEAWRVDVVVPLRTARRNLKEPPPALDAKGAEALRAIVKKAELEAERLQQSALHALTPPSTPAGDAPLRSVAAGNAEAYGAALGRALATGPLGVMLDALEALPRVRG